MGTRAALYAQVSTTDQDVGMHLDELRQVAVQWSWSCRECVDTDSPGQRNWRGEWA